MPDGLYLTEQTREAFHAFYRGLVQDPDLFAEESDFSPWRYDAETVDKLFDRRLSRSDRRSWAVMLDGDCIGDISLKHIDRGESCAEMEICLRSDEFKNRGFGTEAERQLLAIARAAVANPPVLILDEATSSIDTRTEWLIEQGMDSLMAGRTVFVIAHRLSTVRNADAILVLEHGQIIERGSHDDLIKLKGRYYQLYTGKAELD